jgi:hypothetical protein
MRQLKNEELATNQIPSPEEQFEQTCLAYLTVAELRRILREETKWLEK